MTDSSRVLISTCTSTSTHTVIHHFSLHFLQFPFLLHLSTNTREIFSTSCSPEQCTWFSFNSIIPSFNYFLQTPPECTILHFALEENTLHFRIASFFLQINLYITQRLIIFTITRSDLIIQAYILFRKLQLHNSFLQICHNILIVESFYTVLIYLLHYVFLLSYCICKATLILLCLHYL